MNQRKAIALIFISISLVLGAIFYQDIEFPVGLEPYFQLDYYKQFGPLAICVELFVAGYHLFKRDKKVNFTLALFGFTVVLDYLFNLGGFFETQLPLYALVILNICALVAFYLSFTDTYKLGRISVIGTFLSLLLGNVFELFFNYW